uniref:Uncharacterized protein n=1 Tax=Rhizophora mucronata TaxID=61149 RepID=A0A2P2NY20_RHIMU
MVTSLPSNLSALGCKINSCNFSTVNFLIYYFFF